MGRRRGPGDRLTIPGMMHFLKDSLDGARDAALAGELEIFRREIEEIHMEVEVLREQIDEYVDEHGVEMSRYHMQDEFIGYRG